MSAPPAARDGAQAQAMQVRLPGVQGRASLDGAPLHPLRRLRLPPANKMKVHCSRHVQAFTHTHTTSSPTACNTRSNLKTTFWCMKPVATLQTTPPPAAPGPNGKHHGADPYSKQASSRPRAQSSEKLSVSSLHLERSHCSLAPHSQSLSKEFLRFE